ncbi:MAG: hypothetical protein WEB58_06250 [Planctomycetaceae bacterium]
MFGSTFGRDVALLISAFLVLAVLMYADDFFPATSVNRAPSTINVPPENIAPPPVKTASTASANHIPASWGIPPQLLVHVTREFNDTPLHEIVAWMRDDLHIDTRLDDQALEEEGIATDEPMTESAKNEPLYLVLNRICKPLMLDWYERDGIITITTWIKTDETFKSVTYDVADLMRDGYHPRELMATVLATSSGLWEVHGDGEGLINHFDKKISVMQTDRVHCEIADLFEKLRSPARRTFVFDPPQHDVLRERLNQTISVTFRNVPLNKAVAALSHEAGVELRIDEMTLEEEGISIDEAVRYELGPHRLTAVLDAMLDPLELEFILSNGVVFITTNLKAEETMRLAVYDVRDICRSGPEARSLQRLVMEQTHGLWEIDGDGEGTIAFPKIGVMVVSQNEKIHDEILELLNRYRSER